MAVDPIGVDRAMQGALAVYYFPGMWDWDRSVVVPLVVQALGASLDRESAHHPDMAPSQQSRSASAHRLLDEYVAWAPGAERVAPVLVGVDYEADLPDPDHTEAGLFTPDGDHVRYRGRLDMLAVDAHDAYWIVRHRVVKDWTPLDDLVRDEEAVAACWAWEQFYIGMEIAGTVHNEMRLPTRPGLASREPRMAVGPERGGLAQHEGSGGGRSIPQHRRLYAQASEPVEPDRVAHDVGPWFRRTWVRRSRAEIEQAGRQLALEARAMFDPGVAVYPSPSRLVMRPVPLRRTLPGAL